MHVCVLHHTYAHMYFNAHVLCILLHTCVYTCNTQNHVKIKMYFFNKCGEVVFFNFPTLTLYFKVEL